MTTFCCDCDYVIPDKQPWRDLCSRHPRLDGYGFVRRDKWDNAPPYLYCKDVNAGACPLFKEQKDVTNG